MYVIYFSVDKLWKLTILNVIQEYSHRGIASRLVEKALEMGAKRGFTLAMSEFSSCFTQRIGARLGFESVLEVEYNKENYENFDTMAPETGRLHKKCIAMAKRL